MAGAINIAAYRDQLKSAKAGMSEAKGLRQKLSVLNSSGGKGDLDSVPDVRPFEEELKKHLMANYVKATAYNRFDYHFLLDSGLEFLTRAVSLRDDGKELGLRAMNDLLERWKSKKEFDLAQLNIQQIESEASGQRQYAEALSKIIEGMVPLIKPKPKNVEEAGFAKEYYELQAKQANAIQSSDLLKERSEAAKLSLEITALLNQTLEDRISEKGHALNYGERIAAAKQAFLQNVTEAFFRLLAASEGLTVIFPPNPGDANSELEITKFPNPLREDLAEIGFVDRLLNWTRRTLFALERIDSFSHEYRFVLSMSVMKDRGKGTFVPAAGKYGFTLAKADIGGLNFPRLVSLDVHVVPRTLTANSLAEYRTKRGGYAGRVSLPQQGAVGGEVLQLPDFKFGDAEDFADARNKSLQSSSYRYANPLGEWSITMPSINNTETAESVPQDVWVEIVVLGTRRPGQN
jgi:hypothetical protein